MTTPSSGRYRYRCNDEDSGILETWEQHREYGQLITTSTRHATPVGVRLEVNSRQAGHAFRHCSIHWQQQNDNVERKASADYLFENNSLRVIHNHLGQEEEHGDIPVDFVFSPLMRIYNGPVIEQLLEQPEGRKVCVPTLFGKPEDARFLLPSFSERRARSLGDTRLDIDGRALDCTLFEYSGGEYSPGTRFWVDHRGVMLRYCWQQDRNTRWDVMLEAYQPAP